MSNLADMINVVEMMLIPGQVGGTKHRLNLTSMLAPVWWSKIVCTGTKKMLQQMLFNYFSALRLGAMLTVTLGQRSSVDLFTINTGKSCCGDSSQKRH